MTEKDKPFKQRIVRQVQDGPVALDNLFLDCTVTVEILEKPKPKGGSDEH